MKKTLFTIVLAFNIVFAKGQDASGLVYKGVPGTGMATVLKNNNPAPLDLYIKLKQNNKINMIQNKIDI